MSSILLVPVGSVGGLDLASLCGPLHTAFRLPASLRPGSPFDPEPAFDSFRNQYNSTLILSGLLDHHAGFDGKVVGVTTHDLFVPVLTYVFGEAQLDGMVAVVSAHRLLEEYYGMTTDHELERERLLKEIVHELGHTFGLIHCHDPECVMRSSTSVEDIDLKGLEFCGRCNAALAG